MRNVKLIFENKIGNLHVFAKILIVMGGVMLFQQNIIAQVDGVGVDTVNTDGCEPPMIRSADGEVNMRVFPNPVSDYTKIAFDAPYSGDINIYDMQGKLQQSVSLMEVTEIQLDLTMFSPGTYILVPDNTLYQSIKLIKQ